MPSGKKVTPLFGVSVTFLSLYFGGNDFTALAAPFGRSHTVSGERPYTVVIDPGHGGTDTGTSARRDKRLVAEKEISLRIALATAKLLKNPAYSEALGRKIRVELTRTRDTYVSLEARSEKAKKLGADLFLSIHANSDGSHKAKGIEFYFLNNTDDESALKLQQIENRASRRAREREKSSLLLRSVMADAVTESSRSAAETIHTSVVDQLRSQDLVFQDRGVKQAMLYVLLDAQVPAVLVECFYLSNKEDLALMAEPENRMHIAEGLAKGVLRFLATK